MTTRATILAYAFLAAGLATLYGLLHLLATSAMMARAPAIGGAAITFDLTASAALTTWCFGSRRGRLHGRAPLAVIALGLAVARLMLPAGARVEPPVAWALAELVIAGLAVARWPRGRRRYRSLRGAKLGVTDALEGALAPEIGAWPARALAAELGVMSRALTGWWHKTPPEDESTFSMHRRGYYGALVAVLLFLTAGESVALHPLVGRASPTAAWVLTASSIWLALWVVGDLHAVRLEPLRMTAEGLNVCVGVRWRTSIPYDAIVAVARVAGGAARSRSALRATLAGTADVEIVTSRVLKARGLLGIARSFNRLLLTVDRPEAFVAELEAARAARMDRNPPRLTAPE